MPGRTRHGSPARLRSRTNRVAPPLRDALTRNAPWVRKSCRVRSREADGTAGKTRMPPPQLVQNMSKRDWEADSGVSTTGPASVYIVLGRTGKLVDVSKNLSRKDSASSALPIEANIDAAPV